MKKLIFTLSALIVGFTATAQAPISIETARNTSLGQTVTVTGVVTNGSEFGAIRYLQDGTAGIAAYGGNVNTIYRGDSITVTGVLTEFNGLLEIGATGNNPTYVKHGVAASPIVPQVVQLSAINESLEGQLVTVHNVSFTSTGNFPSNNNVNITDGTTNFQVRISGSATNIDGTAIPTGSQSITGIVSQFNDNYQILPRSLTDITEYVAPEKEINVLVNGVNYLTGSTVNLASTTSATINVQNLGVGNLTISNVAFTGAQASAYSSTITNGALVGLSDNVFQINITHQGPGSHNATLTITSDDDDEAQFVLNFEAGGNDGLATEPTSQASALQFTLNKAYKINASYTAAAGNPKYLVLWAKGQAVTGVPQDGVTYQRGDQLGNAKVAYVGSANSFSPRGVLANQHYYFTVYTFNGNAGIENYNTIAPLTGEIVSAGREMGNYYNNIDVQSPTFVSDLTTLINPHTQITYYNYLQTMLNQFSLRDTAGNKTFVECRYSDDKAVFDGTFTWTAADYSREHVYAHSWMPGNPYNGNTEHPAYTDQHNLFPVRMTGVNSVRSNFPFGEIVGAPINEHLGAKRGFDENDNIVFTPKDASKGDVARALMYMAVSYNGTGGHTWKLPSYISGTLQYGQDIDLILQWHFQDLPDAYEIARNEYVYSVQGNRNPFIDSVEFACFINFANMTYNQNGCQLSANILSQDEVKVFPIPAREQITVFTTGVEMKGYEIIDLTGRTVLTNNNLSGTSKLIDVSTLTSGTYLINVSTEKGNLTQKISIQ